MPSRPLRPCSMPGCPALVVRGYCSTHDRTAQASDYQRRRRADERKGDGRQFYSTPEWRAVRAEVLREEPFCRCGCGAESDTVDHIIPRRERPDLALVRSNLRAMYSRCHNRHTAAAGGGFGNRRPGGGGTQSLAEDVGSRVATLARAAAKLGPGGRGA